MTRKRIEARIVFSEAPSVCKEKEEKDNVVELSKKVEQHAIAEHRIIKQAAPVIPFEESDEEDSEDESPITLLRPVFVKKEERKEVDIVSAEEVKKQKEKEAHEMLLQYVRREYEAATAAKNNEEDAGSLFDPKIIDDTDDIEDPVELESWRLRELLRIKRDREERERWEREKMEMERIRNMTEEEKRKIDEEKVAEWMSQPQGQMRFMQKYYHKGAFFQDSEEAIFKRDYAQPTGEDVGSNKEMLPQVKQVRDFGKKGRTKWTHLVGEDTTEFSYGWGQRSNEMNYKMVGKMGGMKGHLDNPVKRSKK